MVGPGLIKNGTQGERVRFLFSILLAREIWGQRVFKHGTEEQRVRFLSSILSAREIWCQGFSEPGAGSDLAAIKTKARVSKEGFHITGQKIWTSFAHIADWCFALCRTSEETQKHKGL